MCLGASNKVYLRDLSVIPASEQTISMSFRRSGVLTVRPPSDTLACHGPGSGLILRLTRLTFWVNVVIL